MNYKPISDRVRVGYTHYNLDFQGLRYCWESSGVYGSAASLEELIRAFRDFNITLDQLDNFGTEKPLSTDAIPENKLEKIVRMLARPTIFVVKLLHKKGEQLRKLNSGYNVFLNAPYVVKIGEDPELYKLELGQVPKLLNKLGCKREDLTILKQNKFRQYSALDTMERIYILSLLKN